MKFRLLELLQCPCGKGGLTLENPVMKTVPYADSLSRVKCRDFCGFRNKSAKNGEVTPQDCMQCYTQEIMEGTLRCSCGQKWPITGGIPRFLPPELNGELKKTQQTFSFEWKMFRFGERNWGQDIDVRRNLFLKALDARREELKGKLIFDAGCGSGLLAIEMAKTFNMEVVGLDLAFGIENAYRHNENPYVYFVQGSVLEPPIRSRAVDYLYCAGVLVACPDTKKGFESIVRTLKQRGRCFIWVYHPIDSAFYPTDWRKLAAYNWVRKNVTSKLPIQLQYLVYLFFIPAFLVKQFVEKRLGIRQSLLTWREKMQNLFDFFSPTYQNRHRPEEVVSWFRQEGFANAEVAYREHEGFGVRGDLLAP
jgi:ubiquinone/menaquinone biosynthesis C-methylase UbiE/uncharacterized protein YbaR (Trm112 family)